MDDLQTRWNRCKSRVTAYYRALTRDFNYSTDFFFGLDFLLAAAGARLSSENAKLQRCWRVYRWTIYFPALVTLWNTVLNVQQGAKLDILLSCMQGMIGSSSSALRMGLILWHYESLMEVRRYVNRRCFGRNLEPSLGIRSAAFYHIRKIVIPSVAIILSVVTSILAIDFSDHHYMKSPVDIKQTPTIFQKAYKLIFCFTLVGLALMTVLVFLVSYMVLTGLIGELKVIAQIYAVIFEETQKRVQRKLTLEPGNSRQQDSMRKHYFWKFVQEEFGECISLHADFLTIKNKIRPFLNATFLTVYFSTVLSLACGAVYVTHMKTVTLFSLESLYYCLWVAIECAFLTRTVSLLTEANESIGWEVYDLDWHEKLEWEEQFLEEYRSVRATMLNVMAVAQQPLRLNCFGFFEFTQDRFYELLNVAYSMYTFLRNFV
ncbi:hypothetical protein quinque_000365 [Culex quinquefasciatus]